MQNTRRPIIHALLLLALTLTLDARMTSAGLGIAVNRGAAPRGDYLTSQTLADLAIVSISDNPDPVVAGANLTYVIRVRNLGPNPAQTVVVTDNLPPSTTYVPGSCQTTAGVCGGQGNNRIVQISTLARDAEVFIVLVARVTSTVSEISNSAKVDSATPDPAPGNNSAVAVTKVIAGTDVAITMSDNPDPVTIGSALTYTITVKNLGPSLARSVRVTDNLPPTTTYVPGSCTTSKGTCAGTGNNRLILIGDLDPPQQGGASGLQTTEPLQDTVIIKLEVIANALCEINNTATVDSETPDPDPKNNSAMTTTMVGGGGGFTVVSAASFKEESIALPEFIASGFGVALTCTLILPCPMESAPPGMPLPTTLAGARVKVRDSTGTERDAGLLHAQYNQINFILPAGTASGCATVRVIKGNGTTAEGKAEIKSVAPGLFSAAANGSGLASGNVLRCKSTAPCQYELLTSAPIDLGLVTDKVYLILYGTGIRGRSNLAAVTVNIGGMTSTDVNYAGAQGTYLGEDQVNALIPRGLIGRGEVNVELMVDGLRANLVTVKIK